ncbi:hypothetical protein [Amycolatopsis eburnea]|uniref:hypothetical protein n=1 Tax=Amycolatopsis eburnea TaxID=2267691 RepID=UPI001CDCF4FD|nr:hypothetical protein [Amycolatopsis eburnea]
MTERELTAQTVVDREVPAEPRLSPDGRWVAFVTCPVGWVGGRRTSTLWLAAPTAPNHPGG